MVMMMTLVAGSDIVNTFPSLSFIKTAELILRLRWGGRKKF